MRFATVQFIGEYGDIPASIRRAEGYVARAAAEGAQAILLPEMWADGFDLDHIETIAEEIDKSRVVDFMKKMAVKHNLYVFTGSFAEKYKGRYYNTMAAINTKGEIDAVYRKIHLFDLAPNEPSVFTPGEEYRIVDTPFGKVGMMICYDIRFPETALKLAMMGAQIIVDCAYWVARKEQWRTFSMSRAMENGVFMVTCNNAGPGHWGDPYGNSMIVDPYGVVLSDPGEKPGVSIGEIDLSVYNRYHTNLHMFRQRIAAVDNIDCEKLLKDWKY